MGDIYSITQSAHSEIDLENKTMEEGHMDGAQRVRLEGYLLFETRVRNLLMVN